MVASALPAKIKNIDKLLVHCQRRRYTAKSNIICAGDRAETLSFIIKGSVTILIEDDDGHEMIIAYLNNGDFFGELGLFEPVEGEQQRSAWVRAKTECEVAEISYEKFRELARQDPEILYALGSQMAQRLRNTTRKVGDLAFFDVTGRVARCLLELCKQPDAMTHPDGMQIKITRQEIGRIVGCSREMKNAAWCRSKARPWWSTVPASPWAGRPAPWHRPATAARTMGLQAPLRAGRCARRRGSAAPAHSTR